MNKEVIQASLVSVEDGITIANFDYSDYRREGIVKVTIEYDKIDIDLPNDTGLFRSRGVSIPIKTNSLDAYADEDKELIIVTAKPRYQKKGEIKVYIRPIQGIK